MTDLIELLNRLRRLPKAKREELKLGPKELADGYRQLRANAPQRERPYPSPIRTGDSGTLTNRVEEHLAMALYRRGKIALPHGESLRLLDYQTPLKSVRSDAGVGKIDLLGVLNGNLAVVELKLRGNSEDRRVGLLEALIDAAIVEANAARIAEQYGHVGGDRAERVSSHCPKALIVAPIQFWTDERAFPTTEELLALVRAVSAAIPLDVSLMQLSDAEGRRLDFSKPITSLETGVSLLPLGESARDENRSLTSLSNLEVEYADYVAGLRRIFWAYRRRAFADDDQLFESGRLHDNDHVVFRQGFENRNLIIPPSAPAKVISAIEGMIPHNKRHEHFGSMRSSQALAQSVFGCLAVLNRLDALVGLATEDGSPAFFDSAFGFDVELEHKVSVLGEPTPTSVDAFFSGPTKIAVEVKLAEREFGRCSRPRLGRHSPNYKRDHCDGSFTIQRGRKERCSLAECGVRYWEFIPRLFDWRGDQDHRPCPLDATYQIVRNILAARVGKGGEENGHALVVYDERNPFFWSGGGAEEQWKIVILALRDAHLLRRVSWQRMASHLAQFSDLDWLTGGLREKYGIC
jgi:hypothetical protein